MDIRSISNMNAAYPPPPAAERSAMHAQATATPIRIDAVKAADRATGKEELADALKSINTALQDRSPGLEFSIDRDSDRSVVKVVDRDTQEVIRQMPSREAIEIAKALDKLHSIMAKATA
ncbi:MAG: flagellar protein FlaG [Massilia sp.]|nr:flagellar protein FlaG [Massilia sp.]